MTAQRRSGRSSVATTTAGAVRIIGGRWRGTRLPVADVAGLRPSSDRVRETLFNWLQPWLSGARVLDLFAGSGALGLEAVSRGATQAVLVERDARLVQALRASVERLQAADAVQVIRADALTWLQAPLFGRFDGVFLDPPFDAQLWPQVLPLLTPWLAPQAWLYLESAADAPQPAGPGWLLHRESRTRQAHCALYRRSGDAAATLVSSSMPSLDTCP
ncbi:MAG: 16S rRNA (guanine(966)-N(2))-methyltransferase RsmD [Pseudoxanthomonas suwonensis]|nr:MAG: 16S rRNA (guanine(966)-N(2))-methyltransferase RsmD [Pseudoxanthomonas suwonensis]